IRCEQAYHRMIVRGSPADCAEHDAARDEFMDAVQAQQPASAPAAEQSRIDELARQHLRVEGGAILGVVDFLRGVMAGATAPVEAVDTPPEHVDSAPENVHMPKGEPVAWTDDQMIRF